MAGGQDAGAGVGYTTSSAIAGFQMGTGSGPPDRGPADPAYRSAGNRLIPKNDPSWILYQAGFQP